MTRKLTIFLIFILIGLATFLAGYLFSKKSLEGTGPQALIGNSLVSRFNKTGEKRVALTGLFELSRDSVGSATLSANGNDVLYYISKTGEIRSTTLQAPTTSTLVAKIQPNASRISWASNRTLIADYAVTGSIFYDLSSSTSKKLDHKIKNAILTRSGAKVAYNFFNEGTGEGNISIAGPDFQSYKNILATRFGNWQLTWLSDTLLALTRTATVDNPSSSVFTLDTETKNFENILDSKNNLELVWSPSGKKMVYSYTDPTTQENGLYLMDIANKVETALNKKIDASRCVWSIDNKIIYCATPNGFVTLDTSSVQPMPQSAAQSVTGAAETAVSATNLMLGNFEDYLVFKNSSDGHLYGLSLSK